MDILPHPHRTPAPRPDFIWIEAELQEGPQGKSSFIKIVVSFYMSH